MSMNTIDTTSTHAFPPQAALERPILIVDDDEDDQTLLRLHLERMFGTSLHVRSFRNGYQLLDYLDRQKRGAPVSLDGKWPWLIFLDIHMPGIDGVRVLERLRGRPDLADTLLLVLSGTKETREIDASFRNGAYSFLQKPFSRADFIETLHKKAKGGGPVRT